MKTGHRPVQRPAGDPARHRTACGRLAGALCAAALLGAAADAAALNVGVDANYSLGMERDGAKWIWDGKAADLFEGMAASGVDKFRVRLWTRDEGQNGKDYATEVVARARRAGLDPYLVIFLSDDWADLMKQPVPAAWKDLDPAQLAEAVRVYSRDIVAHFRKAGLQSHLYEIGNEIDYGICGVYPAKKSKKNPEALSRQCWPEAARLLRASQEGVLEADPEARFLLHIAHWWDADFCKAFFRFMLDHGVRIDFAGLSYFPSANIGGSLEMEQFGKVVKELHEAVGRPVIVPETAYPSTRDFRGQFSRWKKETPGYPLSPDGQRRWLTDFLAFCKNHPAIDSVYYWSPEWFGEGMWKAFAGFDVEGRARPVWSAFAEPEGGRRALKAPRYFESSGGGLRAVPVEEARTLARQALREELKAFQRVNTGYIQAITARKLETAGYRVNLRASLMGNLDLVPLGSPPPETDWKALLERVDGRHERVIVFTRTSPDPLADEVLGFASSRKIDAVVHEVAPGDPLKFGFELIQNQPPEG